MTFHKNLFKHILKCASIFGFVAFVLSCSQGAIDASVSKRDDKTHTLNIEITNYDDVVTSSQKSIGERALVQKSGARTIIPDSFDSDGLDFYLYGSATSGKTFGPTEVTFKGKDTSKTVGTIAISADANVWEFTLVAIEDSGVAPTTLSEMKTNAVLIGHSSMDMANGDTAKFILSPDGLTKEASVAMKLYLDSWGDISLDDYKATAGIYKLTDGSLVSDLTKTDFTDLPNFPTSAPSTANYEVDTMEPGTYLFKVTFENSKTNKKFIWSDVIIILPGKTVENEVAIPNVIGTKPDDPTDFKAGYITGSEDKYNDYYLAEFTWKRGTSKNENYFEIDLLELADATTTIPNDDDSWTSAVDTDNGISTTYGVKFSSSEIYEDGSLLSGNEKVQARLELGKRYFARIRAVNDAGVSDYVYVSLDGTENFTSDTINRYRITYHLNYGKFNGDVEGTPYTDKIDDIVLYYCQESPTGNAIIQPNGTTITLVYEPDTNTKYNWTSWKTGDNTKYDLAANPNYIDYKNLDLYANYETDASVEIFDKSSYEIKPEWISAGSNQLTSKTTTIDVTNETEINWKITPTGIKDASGTDITEFAYDIVNFTVSKGGKTLFAASEKNVKVDVGTTFTMPLDNLSTGTYNVIFTARKGTTTVSCNITTTITR